MKSAFNNIILLFTFILLFLGCSKTDEMEVIINYDTCGFQVAACDPLASIPDATGVQQITETDCLVNVGQKTLVNDSKKYLWFNCPSVNTFVYEDSLGNQINLDIISKIHKLKNGLTYSLTKPGCDNYVEASVDEVMEIILVNEQLNIKFKLDLGPGGLAPKNYDALVVNKTTFDDQRPVWINAVLILFLNNRTPNYTIVRYRFNSQLTIQGESYADVYWNDGRYDVPMEVYYNQACGIIAFRDDQGTLWKIAGYN